MNSNSNHHLANGSKNLISYDNTKPKKANEIINSIVDDDKSEEYVEVEDSDVVSTDGSNSSEIIYTKKTMNGHSNSIKRLESGEDADVNVENSDDDDVVVSKEKYDREKLLNKFKNSTNESKLSAAENTTKTSLSSPSTSNSMTSTIAKNSQPSQVRYETPDSEKKGKHLKIFFLGDLSFLLSF